MRRSTAQDYIQYAKRESRRRDLRHVGDFARTQARLPIRKGMPSSRISPEAGLNSPASIRINVDLPEPLAPITAVMEASATDRLISRTAAIRRDRHTPDAELRKMASWHLGVDQAGEERRRLHHALRSVRHEFLIDAMDPPCAYRF